MKDLEIELHELEHYTIRGAEKIKYIILHDIKHNLLETKAIFNQHKISSHFYITRTGVICQFVAPEKAAHHAGISEFAHEKGLNRNSIGIELEGDWESGFTSTQIDRLERLIKKLVLEFGIEKILSHAEIAPYRTNAHGQISYGKIDPGLNFPWQELARRSIGNYHDIEIVSDAEILFKYGDTSEIIRDIQQKLYYYGYSLIPVNGQYDLKTAAVLNAFYLRYYPEWFAQNQENIRSLLVDTHENAGEKNFCEEVLRLKSGEAINDQWLFENILYLPSSNIDQNTMKIIDFVVLKSTKNLHS